MDLRFASDAWEEYQYWLATGRNVFRRLNLVTKDIRWSPFEGIGKPERFKENLSGWWSRRIAEWHRIVYCVVDPDGNQAVDIASCRYHHG